MNKFTFFLSEGVRTFTNTLTWNIFSIFFLSIFIFFGFVIFEARGIITTYIDNIGSDVMIEIFLADSVSKSMVDSLEIDLTTSNNYDSLSYISKDKALAIFKTSFENIEMPDSQNPLPQSFVLYPKNSIIESNRVYSVIDELKTNPLIEIVNFNKELLDRLAGINKFVDIVTLITLLILTIFGVVIYYTSVYHSLNYKYEYLEVMDYFNAPRFWGSFPFYVESIIISMFSSVAFITLFYVFNSYFVNVYFTEIYNFNTNIWINVWKVLVVQLSLTIFVSILSTFLSLRSYK